MKFGLKKIFSKKFGNNALNNVIDSLSQTAKGYKNMNKIKEF